MSHDKLNPPVPVRIALAGLSHDHVFCILRQMKRADLTLVGFFEPDRSLAEKYSAQFGFAPELIHTDLDSMLDAVRPVCWFS